MKSKKTNQKLCFYYVGTETELELYYVLFTSHVINESIKLWTVADIRLHSAGTRPQTVAINISVTSGYQLLACQHSECRCLPSPIYSWKYMKCRSCCDQFLFNSL